MTNYEKITGSAITKLFDTLILYQIPLKLTLIDTEYQNLIRVKSLVTRKKVPYWVMDIPEGFEKAASTLVDWQIGFEFTGTDQIKYMFTTFGGEIEDSRIFLKMPLEIERKQRRELFRLDAPAGTKLHFSYNDQLLELEVMNISIGGSLAVLVQTEADTPEDKPLAVSQRLNDVELVFPAEILQHPIQIEAVEVKRLELNSQTMLYELGLEFTKIGSKEKKRLTDLIYELQRQYLRHRLPLDL